MRFLDNLKIVTKVSLIVAVLALVIVGALGLSLLRMTELTGTFTDIISKEDAGTLSIARASRRAEGYRAAAFAILTETTEEGNAKQLEFSRTSKAEFDFPQPDQFATEMDDFAECIMNGRKSKVSGEEGLRDIKILSAIYQSIREGKTIKV